MSEDFVEMEAFQLTPINSIFVNLIPQSNKLVVIMGYHKDFTNNWIINFINSWETQDEDIQQRNISELIANRLETWAMSPSYFNSIPVFKRDTMLKHWEENLFSHEEKLHFGINLFG